MNVRGRNNASKVMLMAAAAFNLKKWIKKLLEQGLNCIYLKVIALRTLYVYLTEIKLKIANFRYLSLCGEYQYIGGV
jgi:hypothetical protein